MEINIKATNIELTPFIRDYINKRIGGLEKFIGSTDSSVRLWVEVGKTTRHHRAGDVFRAEVQIRFPRYEKGIRAEVRHSDLYAAIDEAREQIKKDLNKIKNRKRTLVQKGARLFKKLIYEAIGKRFD
jgi:putative sigma-54 modulation protein